MLNIVNFSKTYKGTLKAVDNLNLEVKSGDIYGFIGHNGAGKSTTLKAIAGVLNFEEGEIIIDGISIKEDPILCKQKIAFIPDNPDLYEHLTGLQYLNFISDIFGVSKKIRQTLIQKYADIFEISKNLGDIVSSYSHGMKQKLALISALIHEPKLIIMDEPFVGLDPKAAFSIKEIMKEMCEKGTAILFSTHVLEVAEKICNKIAIIKKGKLIVSGDTKDVVKNSNLENVFLELYEHE
jgi:ABC-2 type transport system ATP-binding protein